MRNQAAISRRSTMFAATTFVTAIALPAVISIAQLSQSSVEFLGHSVIGVISESRVLP